jgi:CMP/dCMP kinase
LGNHRGVRVDPGAQRCKIMIIAVDGPAASGKGTIAKALGAHFGLPVLDTGLLYRAVAVSLMRGQGDPSHEAQALLACQFDDSLLADPALRSESAGGVASKVSAYPSVRQALLARQRDFAHQPGGAVLDGRDIGTVIAPEAHAKLFVTATPQARAARRVSEIGGVSYDAILAEIIERDTRDASRNVAPLVQAEGADLLDTTNLTIAAAVQQAIALVEARMRRPAF